MCGVEDVWIELGVTMVYKFFVKLGMLSACCQHLLNDRNFINVVHFYEWITGRQASVVSAPFTNSTGSPYQQQH
jgi:hypothetical protein